MACHHHRVLHPGGVLRYNALTVLHHRARPQTMLAGAFWAHDRRGIALVPANVADIIWNITYPSKQTNIRHYSPHSSSGQRSWFDPRGYSTASRQSVDVIRRRHIIDIASMLVVFSSSLVSRSKGLSRCLSRIHPLQGPHTARLRAWVVLETSPGSCHSGAKRCETGLFRSYRHGAAQRSSLLYPPAFQSTDVHVSRMPA